MNFEEKETGKEEAFITLPMVFLKIKSNNKFSNQIKLFNHNMLL